MKYQEWLGEWLQFYVQPAVKKRTYEKYRRLTEKHLLPKLGGYELEELTAQVLQKFTAGLVNEGYASNTVNGIISVLKSSIGRAATLGVTNVRCTDEIVRPQQREKRVECFSKYEQRKIEKYIAESEKPALFGIALCLYTGLRIGELLALEWSDLDLKKGILNVSRTCRDEWKDGRYIKAADSPKTSHSCRVIPIPIQLLARLKELKKNSKSEYVIDGKTKYGAKVRSYQKTFELLLKKLNLPHRGFHALRHTFATRALEVGMDVKTLSEILGHGNPSITLRRYAHSMLEHKRKMMNRLGKSLTVGNEKTTEPD